MVDELTKTPRRLHMLANLLSLIHEVAEDHTFDHKRSFFRQLGLFSLSGRGEQIRQITIRRKQRTVKLVPFLVLSCHKLLSRKSRGMMGQAFDSILLRSIQGHIHKSAADVQNHILQSSYHIAEGDLVTQNDLDVSKNLVGNFEQESYITIPGSQQDGSQVMDRNESSLSRKHSGLSHVQPSKGGPKRTAVDYDAKKPLVDTFVAIARETERRVESKREPIKVGKHNGKSKNRTATGSYGLVKSVLQRSRTKTRSDADKDRGRSRSTASVRMKVTQIETSSTRSIRNVLDHPVQQASNVLSNLGAKLERVLRDTQKQLQVLAFTALKRGQTKLRRVASTYKRRNFILIEKKMLLIQQNRMKQAFMTVKRMKRPQTTQLMVCLKQVMLAGVVQQYADHSNLRWAFQAIREEQRPFSSGWGSARSDLWYQSVKIADIITIQSSMSQHLASLLQRTSVQIKGHKKWKRYLSTATILLGIVKRKERMLKNGAWTQMEHVSTVRKHQLHSVSRISEVFNQLLSQKLQLAFDRVCEVAAAHKDKHVSYLGDVITALMKKRGIIPTFHYLRFEVPRIDRHNLRILGNLCQTTTRVITKFSKRLKCDTFGLISQHSDRPIRESAVQAIEVIERNTKTQSRTTPKYTLRETSRQKKSIKNLKVIHEHKNSVTQIPNGHKKVESSTQRSSKLSAAGFPVLQTTTQTADSIPLHLLNNNQRRAQTTRSERSSNPLISEGGSDGMRSKDCLKLKIASKSPRPSLRNVNISETAECEAEKENSKTYNKLSSKSLLPAEFAPNTSYTCMEEGDKLRPSVMTQMRRVLVGDRNNTHTRDRDFFSFQKVETDESRLVCQELPRVPNPAVTQFTLECLATSARVQGSSHSPTNQIDAVQKTKKLNRSESEVTKHETKYEWRVSQNHTALTSVLEKSCNLNWEDQTSEDLASRCVTTAATDKRTASILLNYAAHPALVSAKLASQPIQEPQKQQIDQDNGDECDEISHLTIVPILLDW